MRELLLSIHILAIAVWIGAGFFELYMGRRFLATETAVPERQREAATLLRMTYHADFAVFIATLTAFAAGLVQTFLFDWGFLTGPLWLTVKQVIMLIVLATVALILPRALKLGAVVAALPDGAPSVPPEGYALYRGLEPFYVLMRVLAVVAVILAVSRYTF